MTTAVITQPTYLPWLGYFEAMAHADVYVVLDTVQFQKRSWHSRNRLKGSDGEPFWLSVPVASAPQQTPLAEIRVAPPEQWAAKHRRAIEVALGGTPHADAALATVLPTLDDPPERLVDLNRSIIEATAAALDLAPRWVLASDLGVGGSRSQLLVDLCAAVGADRYFSAAGSREYMTAEQDVWDRSGLVVEFQDWPHPTYPQKGPDPFVPYLAALDAIANIGPAAAADLVRSQAAQPAARETAS